MLSTPRRIRQIGALITVAMWTFAFRGILPYEPFPSGQAQNNELEDWFFRPTGQSPVLIFGLALLLLYSRQHALRAAVASPHGGMWGALLLVPGALLSGWSQYVGAQDLLLLSLVLTCLGTGAALGGNKGLRAVLLPSVFLLLLVPIPAILVNQIIYPLQVANAHIAALSLDSLLGIPATSWGTLVVTDARTFQVIESCAGLQTMTTMLMSAVLYCELFHRGRGQTTILLIAAPVVGGVVNFGRILSLILNPSAEVATVHTAQGAIMTAVGVLALAVIDSVLVRWRPAARASNQGWTRSRHALEAGLQRPLPRSLGAFSVAGAVALASVVIVPWQPERMIWWAPYKIPLQIGDWTGIPAAIDKNAMGSILPNYWMRRVYKHNDDEIEVFVGTDNMEGRQTSLLSGKTVLPRSGFRIQDQSRTALEGIEAPIVSSLLQQGTSQVLSYRWVVGASALSTEILRAFFGVDRSSLVVPRRLMLVRMSTAVGDDDAGLIRATKRLRSFAATLVPALNKIAQPGVL